ncbi:MAG: hypothetical protein ACFE7E_05685 [Candidatus Hodarchaeota archaeon]
MADIFQESIRRRPKKVLLIAVPLVICVSLPLGILFFTLLQETGRPSWLELGSYMKYEQFYVWNGHNGTVYMIWNVTKLNDHSADLHLISHGVNVTDGNVEPTLGDFNFTINVATRETINCSDISYIGEKWPFWIETGVGLGFTIDILYGINTISGSEQIQVLGQQRDCWVVQYDWTFDSMTRWYDKSSGIVLKIRVVLYRQGFTIVITETAVQTNVDLNA